jgi:8-oxo-dGTP diphosphatase
MSTEAPVAVAVALIRRADGALLLCQRPPGKSYALKWEFPGGKVEPGETPEQALVRELHEELEITIESWRLYHTQVATYPDRTFHVHYYLIDRWSGELRNRIFADIHWVSPSDLLRYDILEGNLEICTRLSEEMARLDS